MASATALALEPNSNFISSFGGFNVADQADELLKIYGHLSGSALLEVMAKQQFVGKIAVASSFGAETAALLALVAEVDKALPVLFLDTKKLFPETLAYRDELVDFLGLTDVRNIEPDARLLAKDDPNGTLHKTDPDHCCFIRKVLPLEKALTDFDAWVTGRKQFQSSTRSTLLPIESNDGKVKVNPLWNYGKADIEAVFTSRKLPRHPLVDKGYVSIGCVPCTDLVGEGEDARAGRWRGRDKTECGIHR